MATRIRLQRHGKKGKPFFHVIIADSRSKRDGRFIEKIGTYNPNTNPATIELDFDRALHWVQVGAEASDTARAMLSYKGVLMMDHLLRGVTKGALTEDQAKAKFAKWSEEKGSKIDNKISGLSKAAQDDLTKRLAAEKEVSDAREAARQPIVEEVVEEAPAVEAAPATEAPVKAAAPAEAAPAVETPSKEEAPAAEEAPKTEEPKAE